jgi:hypothetical protein
MPPPLDLGHYTIGFVKIVDTDPMPLGSGTLVQYGPICGVLTAAHVVEKVFKQTEIGFLEFPARRYQAQRLRIETTYLDFVQIGDGPFETKSEMVAILGPDIAFVRLPITLADALTANSSFVNFAKQFSTAFVQPPENSESIDAVLGTVEEWSEPLYKDGPLVVTGIGGLHNVGTAKEIEPIGGLDRFEFIPLPENDFHLPKSYGGTSGDGLWRAYVVKEDTVQKRLAQLRLVGVAYFQTGGEPSERRIICHGPKSIYEKLARVMKEKWPDEVSL